MSSERPEPRVRLNREGIVEAAVQLADTQGLEALTMRELAERLGAKAMSLYNHVASKEDLLDGMVDAVYAEIDLPTGQDWVSAMRARAISARQALIRHPWAIPFMESRKSPGPANLHHHDTVLRVLSETGMTIQAATFAYSLIDSYIYGFALQESSLPFANSRELAATAEQIVALMPADQYPYLRQAAVELPASQFRYADQFETGLDLILDGLRHHSKGVAPNLRSPKGVHRPEDVG